MQAFAYEFTIRSDAVLQAGISVSAIIIGLGLMGLGGLIAIIGGFLFPLAADKSSRRTADISRRAS